jgi:uncharacterized protein YciI
MPMMTSRRDFIQSSLALGAGTALAGCAATAPPEPPQPRDWFIFLERGRPTPEDKAAVAAMQRGHIDNFKRLFAAGQLLAAGPMRDPAGHKRGIVVVRAASREELMGYFQPDEYVRDGYMSVNAVPTQPRRALNSSGIDPDGIEEVRIVLLSRSANAADAAGADAHLQRLLDEGRIGAWYALQDGPLAAVLFARTKDSAALQAALAGYPGLAEQRVSAAVWPQWLGKGVLR